MESVKRFLGSLVLGWGIDYVSKKPDKNLPLAVNWIEKFDLTGMYRKTVNDVRKLLCDDKNNWNIMIKNVFRDIHPKVIKKFLINFIINATFIGNKITAKKGKQYNCNIPWAILMDPTAACNLKCTGCWAAEYSKSSNLTLEELDRIISEGKKLGIYFFLYSGGEPLVRKDDLIKLADKHNDCMFLSFTNATLVDDELAKEMQRVGNMALAISIEGFEDETDMRRGTGTYQKIIKSMEILKKYGLLYGFSTCYHSKNTEVVGSEQYIDSMVEMGCKFGWYFTYMPLGKNAVMDLLASPEQRKFMYGRVRKIRETKPIFVLDFWNDGEYVDGCIAGARSYIHINANGDVEPCAFIHYANVNIRDVSLLEALKSPLFMQYQKRHPFNRNHLRPCPLLDNPQMLKEMVHNSGAYSTQPRDKEAVDDLAEKCKDASEKWGAVADEIWKQAHTCSCDMCEEKCE